MVLVCPDAELLERFLLGQVPEEDWDGVAAHVELCGKCTRRLQHIRVADPLESAFHGVQGISSGPPSSIEERILRQVLENVGDAGPGPVSAGAAGELTTLPDELQAATQSALALGPATLKRLGHYRLLRVLGRGGMGIVFLAEDVRLRRMAAVKMMLPSLATEPTYRERFLREARSAATVESDYIVPIYHVDEDQGIPYLAMQLLKGESLEERVRRERVLPVSEVLRIGREIALGLADAHRHGLIHRDIKPANIFLESRTAADTATTQSDSPSDPGPPRDRSCRVKIVDFGLARAVDGDTQVSQSGPVLGTPAYMAPEQANGEPADARSDLFSLGCVLYHLATGDAPFKRPTLTATLIALVTHHPPRPLVLNPRLPAELSRLVMELLTKDPARRPAFAHEVAARLARLEESGLREAAGGPSRRRRAPSVAAALSVVCGLLILLAAIIYAATDTGTLSIRTEDRDARVRVERDGRLVTILDRSKDTWKLRTGRYTVRVASDPAGLEIAPPNTFVLKRGDLRIVEIRRTRAPVPRRHVQLVDPIEQARDRLRDADTLLGEAKGGIQPGTSGAIYRQFERGQIILPPGSEAAFVLYGPIYEAYAALKHHGPVMGHPRAGILDGYHGSRFQPFERGEIILPRRSKTAYVLYGPYYEAYIAVDDAGLVFGTPKSGIQSGYSGAFYMPFERGDVILPPRSQKAHALYGSFYRAYKDVQDAPAVLGQPTSDVYADGRVQRIDFERGWIGFDGRGDAKVHMK